MENFSEGRTPEMISQGLQEVELRMTVDSKHKDSILYTHTA